MTGSEMSKINTSISTHEVLQDKYLQTMFRQRNIKESTKQGYTSSLRLYFHSEGFHSVKEFIEEAEHEEKERVPLKQSQLKKHLLHYREFLTENMDSYSTIKSYLAKVITIYNHYEIRVPVLPKMKFNQSYQVGYFDLPNKEHIRKAVQISDIRIKALLLFMSSSGTAKAETLSITIETFIKGLREFTDKTEYKEIITDLVDRKDLVPILYLRRIKTDKYYYTCCSPEATHHILLYLQNRIAKKNRDHIQSLQDKLFPMTGSYVMKQFQIINDKLDFGFVGKYRFFRTHTMRKFHASNLGTSAEIIDELEGRSKSSVHETYIKTKPDELRKTYMEYMHNVMIHPENFEGPHCGSNTMDANIRRAVEKVVPQEVVVQQQGVPTAVPLHNGGGDMMVYKELGKLEQRIEQLEKRIKQLET